MFRLCWLYPAAFDGQVIFAGALYISAAMGAESVGGYCATIGNGACYLLEIIAEESGEIIAIALFILTMLSLLRLRCGRIALNI